MTQELKPCPFCGGKADIYNPEKRYFSVRCTQGGCIEGTGYNLAIIDAVNRWNTREDQARTHYLEAMIEQMKDGCNGYCTLDECICEKDQRVIDLKEEVKDVTREYDEAQLSWQMRLIRSS